MGVLAVKRTSGSDQNCRREQRFTGKRGESRFSLAYNNCPGFRALYWGTQGGALSGGVQNGMVGYSTKTSKKFRLGDAKLRF